MSEHHLAKRTISALLRARGAKLRRQGLTDEQAREAATYYAAGRSLAWIANHFGGISPTTVARALRRRGISLRPRPGAGAP
jgi:Helix-turn-helix domain